jgi:outer membrane immunogenic protein
MKLLRTGALGFALLALGASGAIAEGAAGRGSIKDTPYAAPTFVWSGLYVGGAVGYGVGASEFSSSGAGNFLDVNLNGAQWIATVGYDFQLSPTWVLGLFADYAFGEVEGNTAGVNVTATPGINVTVDKQWAVGSRLGVLATPSTLLYASAGYTAARFVLLEFNTKRAEQKLDGFFVGLGVEQAFGRNLSLKLDYRFSDYGEDMSVGLGSGITVQNEVHSVRLGVNYHFGN